MNLQFISIFTYLYGQQFRQRNHNKFSSDFNRRKQWFRQVNGHQTFQESNQVSHYWSKQTKIVINQNYLWIISLRIYSYICGWSNRRVCMSETHFRNIKFVQSIRLISAQCGSQCPCQVLTVEGTQCFW